MIVTRGAMIRTLSSHWQSGGFSSLHEQHLRQLRSRPRYIAVRAERGAGVAEAELTSRFSPIVAQSLDPIVMEVMGILQTGKRVNAVLFTRQDSDMPFPLPETAANPQGIAIYNPELPLGTEVPGSEDFGRNGAFGLRAVVVGVVDVNPNLNEVSLVFNDRRPNSRTNGMSYVRLDREGGLDAGAMSFTQNDVLDVALGVKRRASEKRHEYHRKVVEALPRPAAQEILEKLDLLVQYLNGVRQALNVEAA